MAESEGEMKNTVTDISIADLIAAPLKAASDAQLNLAQSTVEFIKTIGVEKGDNGQEKVRSLTFTLTAPKEGGGTNEMNIEAPLLAIVPLPNLAVEEVNVDFQMEITSISKANNDDRESGVSVCGTVTSSADQTRETNQSAKYHIQVKARRTESPEGLSRILDIMAAAVNGQSSGNQ